MTLRKLETYRDLLWAGIIIVAIGIAIYLGFKIYAILKKGGTLLNLITPSQETKDKASAVVTSINPFASEESHSAAVETLLGGPLPSNFVEEGKRRVYVESLDDRNWLEKLIGVQPPASAYVLEGTGGLF